MKCPKCGFVSHSDLPYCKKCGRPFMLAPPSQPSTSSLSLTSGSSVPLPEPPEPSEPTVEPSGGSLLSRPDQVASPTANLEAVRIPKTARGSEPMRPWREELSERLENFRRRRARLRRPFDPRANLGFDFEAAQGEENQEAVGSRRFEAPQGEHPPGTTFANTRSSEAKTPILDSLPLEKRGADSETLTSAAVEAGELALEHRAVEPQPVGIVLESMPPLQRPSVPADAPRVLSLAPLGRRFLAGVADALVLLSAAGLFALVFFRFGCRISYQPLSLVVIAFIAAFFILVYFGMFTALASSTPGLIWMGLEVRNLEGDYPSASESFWRAFGYLVSVAGLMLGFIWALVDSDGLTWHDRISGTFLTPVTRGSASKRQGLGGRYSGFGR